MRSLRNSREVVSGELLVAGGTASVRGNDATSEDRDLLGRAALESMGHDHMGDETPLCGEYLQLDVVWCGSQQATDADVVAARRICAECPSLQRCDSRARVNPFTPHFLAGTTRDERVSSLSRRDRIECRRRAVALLHGLGLEVTEMATVLSGWMGATNCSRRTVEQDIAYMGLAGKRRNVTA